MVMLLLLISFLFFGCTSLQQDREFQKMTFRVLDVGQGLSQVVQWGDSAVIFDVGDSEISRWDKLLEPYGIEHIKMVVISHDDRDHSGGLSLLDKTELSFSGVVLVTPWSDTSFLQQQSSQELLFKIVEKGDTISLYEEAKMAILWPPKTVSIPISKNEYSMVCKVLYNKNSILLTGDIGISAAQQISSLEEWRLKSDIMVVPHHGSKNSLHPSFFSYVAPSTAIVSCGESNSYGHPDSTVISFLKESLNANLTTTSLDGTSSFYSDGYGWYRE